MIAILIGWSGRLVSEEEREQDVWKSGNRGETRHETPKQLCGQCQRTSKEARVAGAEGARGGKREPGHGGPGRLPNWLWEPSIRGSDREVTHSRLGLKRGMPGGVSPYAPRMETGRAVSKLPTRSGETC